MVNSQALATRAVLCCIVLILSNFSLSSIAEAGAVWPPWPTLFRQPFDWAQIKRCATEPVGEYGGDYIKGCRAMLAARHQGYEEAKPGAIDPIQPEPMKRLDDFGGDK